MNSVSLAGTGKYDDGADRIEILESIIDQICTNSIFKREDLRILLLEWIDKGYAWIPTDDELILFITGDL